MTHAHGSLGRYKTGEGCHCPECQAANTAYENNRTRMIAYGRWQPYKDAAGTRRRLQALIWNGRSIAELAARLGWSRPTVRHKMEDYERVSPATEAKVRALYDELWDVPPREGTSQEKRVAAIARRYARERGWVPVGAWDDDPGPHCIDDPAAVPAPGWDTSPIAAAIREARVRAGLSRPRLAALVGVSRSAVQSWEQAERTPSAETWVQLELTLGPLGVVRDRQEQATTEDERDAAA